MGFSCGIVGLPNVGKSTIFNALTHTSVPASNYPFCTIEPNVGMVPVPDSRLSKLSQLVPTEKVVTTVMKFVDIAGLVKGASQGEGLGNQFLSHIAEVEAIAHVVRCFESDQIVHVSGSIDPKRDIDIIHTELALRDLSLVTGAQTRLGKSAKSGDKQARADIEALQRIAEVLDQGRPARTVTAAMDEKVWERLKTINLLTVKPVLYVANISEAQLGHEADDAHVQAVQAIARAEGAPCVTICGSIDAQIAELETDEERAEFMSAMGLEEPGLYRLIRAGYELLGLSTFFTVGPKENRAWTIRRGACAPEAAGKIHSDMERGFIRAEVIAYDDFVSCGSEAAARDQGKLRIEGKEYVVADGDIMHFRFSV